MDVSRAGRRHGLLCQPDCSRRAPATRARRRSKDLEGLLEHGSQSTPFCTLTWAVCSWVEEFGRRSVIMSSQVRSRGAAHLSKGGGLDLRFSPRVDGNWSCWRSGDSIFAPMSFNLSHPHVSASALVACTPYAPRAGYGASPPQPLLPGEAVGELPDKAGIRRGVSVFVCS